MTDAAHSAQEKATRRAVIIFMSGPRVSGQANESSTKQLTKFWSGHKISRRVPRKTAEGSPSTIKSPDQRGSGFLPFEVVSYIRVSTARQGASGLGLEAQRAAVAAYLNGGDWTLLWEVVQVESGKKCDREGLASALRLCRQQRATLIIAKLDRLARNVAFTANLMESGVDFIAADMPTANKLTIHILSVVAEEEARAISKRIKAALEAAKARGTKLGGRKVSVERFAEIAKTARQASAKVRTEKADGLKAGVLPIIEEIRKAGVVTLRGIATELNARGERTQRGMEWSSVQVMRVLGRV